jgi:filamentous hemagglutinin family protein
MLLGGFLFGFTSFSTHAEVVVSGSNQFLTGAMTLDETLGQRRGTNVFHSFDVFNVFAGFSESANFTASTGAPTTNVVTRVTGAQLSVATGGRFSVIDGPLSSSIPGANLFLINPHGVIFGDNASLSVMGSFYATTADYVKLGNGGIFYADPAQNSVLTSASVSAFGFLNPNPAPIDVGLRNPGTAFIQVTVPTGETLSLVGGDVNVGLPTGSAPAALLAPDGRINLVSVASAGEAAFNGAGFDVSGFSQLGNVNLLDGNIGGAPSGSALDAKDVFVQGANFTIRDSVVFPGLLNALGAPVPAPNGGQVNVAVSNDVTITGTLPVFGLTGGIRTRSGSPTAIAAPANGPDVNVAAGGTVSLSGLAVIRSERFTLGNAGNVVITADRLSVSNGASVAVSNFVNGPGGNLTVNANQVDLARNGSARFTGLTTQSNFHPLYPVPGFPANPLLTNGDGGKLTVTATDSLTVRTGAEINSDSFGFGRSGDVVINAGTMNLSRDGAPVGSIASQSEIAGNAGNITIATTGPITMSGGFQINATTSGLGDGGFIDVAAGGPITISGLNTGLFSAAIPSDPADLNAFARTFNNFGFPVPINTFADLAGLVGLPPTATPAQVIQRLDSADFTAVNDVTDGNAGSVAFSTPQLTMQDGARIDSSTVTNGNGGALDGNVGSAVISSGARIRSQSGLRLLGTGQVISGTGDAGSVNLDAAGAVTVTGADSAISTNTLGDGDGGDINIRAFSVAIDNGGAITADSSGAGLAGNITINTGDRITLNGGAISTRAAISDGGNIVLTAPVLVDLLNSQITTSVESGVGAGGNIFIDPIAVVLQNSSIVANAFGGPGGNIRIVAGQFITDQASIVSASSALGIDGLVEINAPDTNLTGKLVPLPKDFLDASKLLRDRCGAQRGGTSSFSAKGHGGVPPGPDGYLPSYARGDAGHHASGTDSAGNSTGSGERYAARGPLLAMAGTRCTW